VGCGGLSAGGEVGANEGRLTMSGTITGAGNKDDPESRRRVRDAIGVLAGWLEVDPGQFLAILRICFGKDLVRRRRVDLWEFERVNGPARDES
jgi:hypothetical protein